MKSVVIYAYYQSESSNYNLSFFCKKELTYNVKTLDNISMIYNIEEHNKTFGFLTVDIQDDNKIAFAIFSSLILNDFIILSTV